MSLRLPRATFAVAVALATAGSCAAPALAAPAPHRGRTVIVARVSGTVRISQPHSHAVTVHRPIALRSGGTLVTTGGVAAVTVSARNGQKTAEVSHGDSRVTQSANGETTFTLVGLACSSDAMSDSRRPPTGTLWVRDHHGPFISRGGYASGAARGTEWTTTDTCDSTTIHVHLGKVLVTDFVHHRHVLVSAGHSYTARKSTPGPGPKLAWTAPQPIGNGGALNSISCPTTSFCAAVDSNGDVLTTTNPAAGAGTWTTTHVASSFGFSAISCPTSTLCLATETITGNMDVSTDPTGGAGAWSETNLVNPDGNGLGTVTCPTTTLCVVTDGQGDVLTTTDPTSGNWSTDPIYPGGEFNSITCAGAGLCIAVGSGLSTSTNPAGGTGAWRTTTSLGAVSAACPTTSLCLLGDGTDDIYVSTDPTGGPSTYKEQSLVDSNAVFATITSVDCPNAGDCLAVDSGGDVVSTEDPAAGPWTTVQSDPNESLNAISCPSTTLCVAVDAAGNEIVGSAADGADVVSGGSRAARTPRHAVAASAATRVVVTAGFTVGGTPTMRIIHTIRGSCFSTSDEAPRDDAYRCMSGNELFDPCLAPPASVRAGNVVVCPTDPFRNTGIEIRLTKRLPPNAGPRPSDRGVPFAIRLTNGCDAMLEPGATAAIGRNRANYYCARIHQWLWGAPSRRGRVWTIWSAPLNARRLTRRVSIAEAWF